MIPHLSTRVAQPVPFDPAADFPAMNITADMLFPDGGAGNFQIDCAKGAWALSLEGAPEVNGLLGQSFRNDRVALRTWPIESPATLLQAISTANLRTLLQYADFDPRHIEALLGNLDAVRDAASGQGPFPIHLYRAQEHAEPIAEEHDILKVFEIDPQEAALAHLVFSNADRSALLVRVSGFSLGKDLGVISDRAWGSLKFPALNQTEREEVKRREAA